MLAIASLLFIVSPAPARAATEIQVWHSLQGAAASTFLEFVAHFNAQQAKTHVTAIYKGDAEATVASGLAAFAEPGPAKRAPDLLQVQDYLIARLIEAKVAIKPMDEVLKLVESPDFKSFVPATVSFVMDPAGNLYGFPLLAAIPIFLYNKDVYRKAQLDPEVAPKTWRELQVHLLAIQNLDTGVTCGYTTSDQAWVHVFNLASMHGETFATRNNGMDGPGSQLTFNDLLHVRHTALMESWVKSELFSYSGHKSEGDVRFIAGQCATLTSASSALADVLKAAKFQFGVAPVPFYPEAAAKPVAALVGGSLLLAFGGKSPEQYRAAAQFLAYFSTPVVAAEWHQKTGSLPLTEAAFLASEKGGFYDRVSGFGVLIEQLVADVPAALKKRSSPAAMVRGVRLPRYDKVRDVVDSELEEVWADRKAPKQGLDDAVRLGNVVLRGEPLAWSVKAVTTVKPRKSVR